MKIKVNVRGKLKEKTQPHCGRIQWSTETWCFFRRAHIFWILLFGSQRVHRPANGLFQGEKTEKIRKWVINQIYLLIDLRYNNNLWPKFKPYAAENRDWLVIHQLHVRKGLQAAKRNHKRSVQNWENINARITLPLTFNMENGRNLLTKIVNYKLVAYLNCYGNAEEEKHWKGRCGRKRLGKKKVISLGLAHLLNSRSKPLNFRELFDLPVSITVLPDCLDALLTLMIQRNGGNLNLVNPGPISLYDVVKLYKKVRL